MPRPLRELPPEAQRAIIRYRLGQAQSIAAATCIALGIVTLIVVQVLNPSRDAGMKYYVGALGLVALGTLIGSLSRAHRDRR